MPLRIGIVGARRNRHGVGEHVARHLAALSAEVVAVVGTRPETAEEGRCQLEQRYGVRARAYTSLPGMLAEELPDAVAICSPQECHREHLEQALAAGVHVLCEKPLVFNPGRNPVDDARPLVGGFAAAGKVLMVNEQWPYTLPAFQRLYPRYQPGESIRDLTVLLSPSDPRPEMIPSALPHALSLLFALAPGGGRVERLEVLPRESRNDAVTAADVHLDYRHRDGVTHVNVLLRHAASQPRPAGYVIDGYAGWRHVRMPSYEMWLATDAIADSAVRRVPLEDPLRLLLADFLNRCNQASAGADFKKDRTILQRLAILRDAYRIAEHALNPASSPVAAG
jgi:hypothetical protein